MKNYKKLTTLGMMCAMAFIAVAVCRIPIVLFLSYEPKDVIITMAGFIFGPLSALIISAVVSFIEMVTISQTGIIGFIMNILSSCAFSCTASYIYKKKHTIKGAVIGLTTGTTAMVTIMLLWNYLITPLYMNVERSQVVSLLIPAFLPFNLIKGILNSAITLILYKPLVKALRNASLIPKSSSQQKNSTLGIVIASAFVILSCVLAILTLF